uniref:HMG box domain-containing protein n=1 Tax=Rattus norvegicus TaxID=10116 RepID=A0ABK0LR53_RAT
MGKDSKVRPKVNVSPYVHFMMDFRNQTREQQPNIYYDFTEFSRKCSEKWKTISKKEKKKYEALAKSDKDRYQREMRNYSGPRRERRRRDADAPRKPPSSFLLFSQDHFEEIKEQHPNWTVAQVAKRDKDRYQREMRNYSGPRRERRRRDPDAPRKPPSSFLLFSQDHFDEIKEQHPNWTVAQVAKAAGRMWARCSEADKIPYEERAAVLRAKYLEEREAYYHQCQRGE